MIPHRKCAKWREFQGVPKSISHFHVQISNFIDSQRLVLPLALCCTLIPPWKFFPHHSSR
jgi:hypothetical protein